MTTSMKNGFAVKIQEERTVLNVPAKERRFEAHFDCKGADCPLKWAQLNPTFSG